jgi:hypothetical protein
MSAERGAFRIRDASIYIGLEPDSDWLLEPTCPIARSDIRRVGARRPLWVWRREALDAFLREREVAPGAVNPQARSQ